MCIPLESGGFQCAPCPDGFTGDGVHCDDVDEVGTEVLLHAENQLLPVPSSVFLFVCPSASLTPAFLVSRV